MELSINQEQEQMTSVELKERFQSMESTLRSVVQVMEKLVRGKNLRGGVGR